MRRSIEGSVYQRAAFFPNCWLKLRRSIEGGVYQRAAFIKGNTIPDLKYTFLMLIGSMGFS